MRLVVNPLARRSDYTKREALITNRAAAESARREISTWPDYAPTPVRSFDGLAKELGLGQVMMKDESGRLNLGSFKSLGGAYAALLRMRELQPIGQMTLCCATEGNHGRSVAFAAKRLNCRAVIFMSENSLDYKARAIEALGATVIRTKGTYDEAVRRAQADAESNGWLLISDTNDPDDPTVLRVMQGYGVMVLELLEQLGESPTHVFVQGGVGGLATGVAGVFSDALGARRPSFIVVEPETAACLFESATRFAPSKIGGSLQTRMNMLAVGEASSAAWPVLQRRVDAFLAIDDDAAVTMAERLGHGLAGHAPLDIGITGAASLAGLVELMQKREVAETLGLTDSARVLVFGTEAGPPHTAEATASDVKESV